jgi:hypothetical protein
MKSEYLQLRINEVDFLFSYFDSQNMDEYQESHMAKYLAVIISGIYEDIIKDCFDKYLIDKNIPKEVRDFMNVQIRYSFRNPDMSNLKKLLKSFSKTWSDKIDLIDRKKTDALDSIVNNKNKIAHGGNSNITYNDIKDFYVNSKGIIEEVCKILL